MSATVSGSSDSPLVDVSGASTGSTTLIIRGPGSPCAATAFAKPWNSAVAVSLMPATTAADFTTARYLVNRSDSADGTVSALLTGMQSYAIIATALPDRDASASSGGHCP